MKTENQIKTKILRIFESHFEDESMDWQRLWSDYNFSSIQLIYFLKDLESEFGPIPLAEFYDLRSGHDLVMYILKRS